MRRSGRLWGWLANWESCCTGGGEAGKVTNRCATNPNRPGPRQPNEFDSTSPVRVTARSRRNGPPQTERQFDAEMAAPVLQIVNPNWHRSPWLPRECEWKQG